MFGGQLLFGVTCFVGVIICSFGHEDSSSDDSGSRNELETKVDNFYQAFESWFIDSDNSDFFDSGAYFSDDLLFCESLLGVCTHSLAEFDILINDAATNGGLSLSWSKPKYLASTPSFTSLPSVLAKVNEFATVGDCQTLIHDRYWFFFFNENGNLISQIHVTDANENEALICT